MPDFALERAARAAGHRLVVGIDEAGRGPWAGPVVAAACLLDAEHVDSELLAGLDDSKKLSPTRRQALFERLHEQARFGIGEASVADIDRLNILQATFLAMARAVDALGVRPDLALVDGNRAPPLPCPVQTVVGGDGRSLSIAAASILAKVSRDRIMAELAHRHPGYGWERNAGYGTAEHRNALKTLGVTAIHRRSYAPIAKILLEVSG